MRHTIVLGISMYAQMMVSKNGGSTKWMVYILENPTKMDDLEVRLFYETLISYITHIPYLNSDIQRPCPHGNGMPWLWTRLRAVLVPQGRRWSKPMIRTLLPSTWRLWDDG